MGNARDTVHSIIEAICVQVSGSVLVLVVDDFLIIQVLKYRLSSKMLSCFKLN